MDFLWIHNVVKKFFAICIKKRHGIPFVLEYASYNKNNGSKIITYFTFLHSPVIRLYIAESLITGKRRMNHLARTIIIPSKEIV